ncbi:hypothetical protein JW905_12010, partial [bacterium]|nr:hypothetical protein [candidate division CSSED10-310 bacterium]
MKPSLIWLLDIVSWSPLPLYCLLNYRLHIHTGPRLLLLLLGIGMIKVSLYRAVRSVYGIKSVPSEAQPSHAWLVMCGLLAVLLAICATGGRWRPSHTTRHLHEKVLVDMSRDYTTDRKLANGDLDISIELAEASAVELFFRQNHEKWKDALILSTDPSFPSCIASVLYDRIERRRLSRPVQVREDVPVEVRIRLRGKRLGVVVDGGEAFRGAIRLADNDSSELGIMAVRGAAVVNRVTVHPYYQYRSFIP